LGLERIDRVAAVKRIMSVRGLDAFDTRLLPDGYRVELIER
jgi:hypothetical protein